jgi:predicted 3-demethylubiquinone-9 3-methyltransferase (glyoxalase superfamily)
MIETTKQAIVPFMWFNGAAEEAANFYTGIFPESKIVSKNYYPQGSPAPAGSVLSVNFELRGQLFYALNGGPQFKFTPAISLFVHCSSQEEVDYYWDNLLEGGKADMCGWLQDKFGLSWQIIPKQLGEYLQHKDGAKAKRAMEAMLKMRKIDIQKLIDA